MYGSTETKCTEKVYYIIVTESLRTMGNNFKTIKSDWVEDQFEGFGTLFNENPEKLWEPFDCSDFDEIGEFWLQYEC